MSTTKKTKMTTTYKEQEIKQMKVELIAEIEEYDLNLTKEQILQIVNYTYTNKKGVEKNIFDCDNLGLYVAGSANVMAESLTFACSEAQEQTCQYYLIIGETEHFKPIVYDENYEPSKLEIIPDFLLNRTYVILRRYITRHPYYEACNKILIIQAESNKFNFEEESYKEIVTRYNLEG